VIVFLRGGIYIDTFIHSFTDPLSVNSLMFKTVWALIPCHLTGPFSCSGRIFCPNLQFSIYPEDGSMSI
jgi:hypothetical protein